MTCLFMSLPEDDETVQADNHSGLFFKELCHLVLLRSWQKPWPSEAFLITFTTC